MEHEERVVFRFLKRFIKFVAMNVTWGKEFLQLRNVEETNGMLIKVLFNFGRGSSDEDVAGGFIKKVHLAF